MIVYFDCSSGISGDMILGALIDAGVSPRKLRNSLSGLPIKGYSLKVRSVKRAGIVATKVDVEILKNTHLKKQYGAAKRFRNVEEIIKKSTLSKDIKTKGLAIFKRLFKAEAAVHGRRFDTVHLHELGAIDCFIDIFGSLIGLDLLGINKIYASPLNLGSGTVKSEHGTLPVPAPATVEVLRHIPVYSTNIDFELTTPTGAVLISSLAEHFGPMPNMTVSQQGIGAGRRNLSQHPNILRLLIGQNLAEKREKAEHKNKNTERAITVVETNIDDMNPQIYEHVMEKLLKHGALDVFLTPVIMKKTRPGIKLTVLCNKDSRDAIVKVILKETTSIGLRFYDASRKTLSRTVKSVSTKFGKVPVKVSKMGDETLRITPEYDDCRKIARKFKIPLGEVMQEARVKAWAKKANPKKIQK
jgi:uncharacterized protein (TIGR00299 family) protein